jgi:aryl-alcohol dehydrogenase-like predicted oxidoreductase
MQYKNLGKSGLVVSRVSFGDPTKGRHSCILNEEQSRPIIRQAVETGINFSTPPICTKQVPVKRSWTVR